MAGVGLGSGAAGGGRAGEQGEVGLGGPVEVLDRDGGEGLGAPAEGEAFGPVAGSGRLDRPWKKSGERPSARRVRRSGGKETSRSAKGNRPRYRGEGA